MDTRYCNRLIYDSSSSFDSMLLGEMTRHHCHVCSESMIVMPPEVYGDRVYEMNHYGSTTSAPQWPYDGNSRVVGTRLFHRLNQN